jgi:hypothetical protein
LYKEILNFVAKNKVFISSIENYVTAMGGEGCIGVKNIAEIFFFLNAVKY